MIRSSASRCRQRIPFSKFSVMIRVIVFSVGNEMLIEKFTECTKSITVCLEMFSIVLLFLKRDFGGGVLVLEVMGVTAVAR